MPESPQMIVARAFSTLWERLYNPPYPVVVELSVLEREMIKILLTLTDDGANVPEERWVLDQLALGPRTLPILQWGWIEHELARVPDPKDRTEYEAYFAHCVKLAKQAVKQVVYQLLSAGRIQWVDGTKELRLS